MEGKAFFCESGEEFFLEEAFLVFFEAADPFFDGVKLFADVPTGDVPNGGCGGLEGVEAADPDLKKFVKIGAGDGEEFDAVEKWEVGAQGFVKHALVEFEPGEFAIDVGRLHGGGVFKVGEISELGCFVENDFEAVEVFEEVGLRREGEALGGGIDHAFEVEGGFVFREGDGEVFDVLGVGAFQGVGNAEEGGELGDAHAVVGAELVVEAVRELRGVLAVVAGDEGDEEAVGVAESKNFGMADDVEAVDFVRAG